MTRERLLGFLFGLIFMSIFAPRSAFIVKRSVDIPDAWNLAPSLEIDQKIATAHENANEKLQVTDKVPQDLEMNKSTKNSEEITREKRLDMDNIENATKLATFIKPPGENLETITSGSRNVVLIFVNDRHHDREDFWLDFQANHSFPVKGFLKNCYSNEIGSTRASLKDELIRSCERLLHSKITALLSWTRSLRDMTTVVASGVNFTSPFSLGYVESMGTTEEFDENNLKPEVHKIKSEVQDDWHSINLGKPTNSAPLLVVASKETGENENSMDIFSMFSKIRIALFRTLLESLTKSINASENSAPAHKCCSPQSRLVDVIDHSLKKFKNLPKDKSYILVTMTSGNELNSIVELFQREISQDTLLVVTGLCSRNSESTPFFAQGPASQTLFNEATTILDIPWIIRTAISNYCSGSMCRYHWHFAPPFFRFIPEERSAQRSWFRFKKDVENVKNDTTSNVTEPNFKVEETPREIEQAFIVDESKNETFEMQKEKMDDISQMQLPKSSSTASNIIGRKLCIPLGTILSIFTATVLKTV